MALLKTFLAIGIAIVFALFIGYGVYTLYEAPTSWGSYNAECSEISQRCQDMVDVCFEQLPDGAVQVTTDSAACAEQVRASSEYRACDKEANDCRNEAIKESERYKHSRNSFYILMLIAIITLIAGFFLSKLEGIGSGLIGGAILTVIWTLIYTTQYWTQFNKFVKLGSLAVVLVLLIFFGYKKIEKYQK